MSNEKLLSKCLHGKVQNNKSLNGLIWKRCSKDVYVGRTTLELGVASAVISFNDSLGGILKVLYDLHVSPGKSTQEHCFERNIKQKSKSVRAQRKELTDK